MAIAATTVWEVRSTATANNVNGGGFNPSNASAGTDKTLSDGASYNFANLASTNGTTNPSVVTSASHTFDSTDNGNLIHITAGTNWTAGWYEIVSTSGGAATLDRAVGTAASLSSGTFAVGGALSLGGASDNTALNAVVAGNQVWIKSGTYTMGASVTLPTGGLSTIPKFYGYNANRNDNPTVQANMPQLNFGASQGLTIPNLSWIRYCYIVGGPAALVTLNIRATLTHCRVVNNSATASRVAVLNAGGSVYVGFCEISSIRGIGIDCTSTVYGSYQGNYIHSCVTGLRLVGTGTFHFICDNIFSGCKDDTIRFNNANLDMVLITGNTFCGFATVPSACNGLNLTDSAAGNATRVLNNIFWGFSKGWVEASGGAKGIFEDYNSFFNNTANADRTLNTNDITTDPAFTSVTNYSGSTATTASGIMTDSGANFANVTDNVDFLTIYSGTGVTAGIYAITSHTATTITTSPALTNDATANKVYRIAIGRNFSVGANMKALAGPATFGNASTTTNYRDIGAVQRVEPGSSTDPGISNVRSGTGYSINGSSLTGTAAIPTAANVRSGTATDATTGSLAVPAAANVLSGVSVDAGTGTYVTVATSSVKTGVTYGAASALTGTYTGSDRWTDPGEANTRLGTAYKADSLTNNKTGTAAIPTAANVRSGTATDATTGSLAVPSAANVLSGVSVDATTGTYVTASAANVKTGIAFGAASAETGTYTGADRWTDPGEANVRSGTAYKANSTSNNKSGTAAIPVAGDVRSGTSTDATTGSLAVPAAASVLSGVSVDAGIGTYVGPSVGNVKTGVAYGAASALTGTYDGSDRWTDPGEANVKLATAYKANSTSNNKTGTAVVNTAADVKTGVTAYDGTGTYTGSDRWTDPAEANVRSGTAYKADSLTNNKTGTAAIPGASDVRLGVSTDATTGALVVPTTAQVKVGVSFDTASTGTYDGSDRWTSPSAGDLRSGTQLKSNSTSLNLTGTLVAPSLANTKTGVAGDGGTGTYDGSDRWTDPGIANVRDATAYKANSTSNNRTGTLDLPTEANVKTGVTFDGATKTGTYDGSDRWSTPLESQVLDGVTFKANSVDKTGDVVLPDDADVKIDVDFGSLSSLTGTYDGSDRFDDLDENLVKYGTQYNANDVVKVGLYTGADRWSDPGDDNVRKDVTYNANTVLKTGRVTVPGDNQVALGVTFDADESDTGTYDGSDRFSSLAPANVRLETSYRADGIDLSGEMIGNLAADVKHGIESDGGTGTYRGDDLWEAVTADLLKSGEVVLQDGEEITGELTPNVTTNVIRGTSMSAPKTRANSMSAPKFEAILKKR